ncbi:unnamed protein product, partial [Owenia fusiformis]
ARDIILRQLEIDVELDSSSIHPEYICHRCRKLLRPDRPVSEHYSYDVKLVNKQWCSPGDLSEAECWTCQQHQLQSSFTNAKILSPAKSIVKQKLEHPSRASNNSENNDSERSIHNIPPNNDIPNLDIPPVP